MYDHHFDTLGFKIKEDYKYKRTVELGSDILLDFSDDGTPVALEILEASKVLKVDKQYLAHPDKNLSLNMNININKKVINLECDFKIKFRGGEKKQPITVFTVNNDGLPVMQADLATV
jgi:uncharacterized protein YuzE